MFTINNTINLTKEFKAGVAACIETMYDVSEVQSLLNQRAVEARISALKLVTKIPEEHRMNVEIPMKDFSKAVKDKDKDVKRALYDYRHATIRVMLLNSITQSKVKLGKLTKDTLTKILESVLYAGTNEITLSQAIHNTNLKVNLRSKSGVEQDTSMWVVDEIRLQFINELAELDFLNMRISDHTHMVSIPDEITDTADRNVLNRLAYLADLLQKKTILLEPAPIDDKNMITRSSWYYQTPELSEAQREFIWLQHNIVYQFIDGAEDMIEEAYREHLQVATLPKWALKRVEFFKEQIRASNKNGGHHIAGKFDSALRWYMMAEIGHFQTSPALRALVKVKDIDNKVKYDMKNNVVQMYAVNTGIKDLARPVGLVHADEATVDVRIRIGEKLNEAFNIDVFNKDNIKPLFMVWAYNAGKRRLLDGVYTEEQEFFGMANKKIKVPGLLELTGIKDEDLVWSVWTETVNELVPAIVALKAMFNKIIKANPLMEASWTLPDGSIAQYASADTLSETLYWVDSQGRQRQHTHHRKELVENAKAAGLLPRSIHSIDAWFARTLCIRAAKLGIIVVPNHDSFTFDDQYVDIMIELVRELFCELLDNNAFANIISELNKAGTSLVVKDRDGESITTQSFGDLLTKEDIMKSMPMDLED